MTPEQAIQLVGYLAGGTTGWNDEAVEIYVHEFVGMSDVAAATEACQRIVKTWDEARRPPIGAVLSAYRTAKQRLDSMRNELPRAPERGVNPRDGWEIARQAYRAERVARGRDPDVAMESWLKGFGDRGSHSPVVVPDRAIRPGTRVGIEGA